MLFPWLSHYRGHLVARMHTVVAHNGAGVSLSCSPPLKLISKNSSCNVEGMDLGTHCFVNTQDNLLSQMPPVSKFDTLSSELN